MSVIRDRVPDVAAELTDEHRVFLRALADAATDARPESGESWQNLIFQTAGTVGMKTNRTAFAALYAAFLGRENGPRAGWLLASLDPAFVTDRLRAAADFGAAA
jgi:lysyl-tRNA synthetase class 1